MPRKTKPIEKNPFLVNFHFSTKWVLNTQRGYESIEIDIEQHVKVYPQLAESLDTLTSSELKLLSYIMTHFPDPIYEKGEEPEIRDYIELSPKLTGMAESTFHKAKAGLILIGLITARITRQSTYWINPALLFKGSRVKMYPNNTFSVNKDPLEDLKKADVVNFTAPNLVKSRQGT